MEYFTEYRQHTRKIASVPGTVLMIRVCCRSSSRPLKVYAVCIPIHCPKIAPVPGICKELPHDSLTPTASYLASPHGDDEPACCDASEVRFI